MTLISYAQNYEDVMLWRALSHVSRGFYIDIGAYSPDLDSVTRAFSERDWHGINVEPNPYYLAQLNARRPNDINLGIAVSDFNGEIELSVIADTGLTTVDSALAETHASGGWSMSRLEVPAQTLAALWDRHVPEGQAVHFLKIDVEGHEAAVLRGADWSRHRPWIVVIEATVPGTQIVSYAEWEKELEEAGYAFAYWDGLNRFYLASEHADLAEKLSSPPNVFDDFILYKHHKDKERAGQLEEKVSELQQKRGTVDERLTSVEKILAQLTKDQGGLQESVNTIDHALAEHATIVERGLRGVSRALSQEIGTQRHVLHEIIEETRAAHLRFDYVLGRSIWEKLLFRPSGRPRKPVRILLFHASGKPRGIFRRWVLHRDGRPRKLFRMWMTGASYQALRYPASRQGQPGADVSDQDHPGLSPRGRYFLKRLRAPRTLGGER